MSRSARDAQVDAGPVDPDVDVHVRGQRREWSRHRWVLPTIALGGMLGATGRYALELALPHPGTGVPWATLWTNAGGCLLIGILMVQVVEVGRAHPLLRPFIGVGVLGGFTTFSSVSVQVTTLLTAHRPALAVAYLFGTLVAALVCVSAGVWTARAVVRVRRLLGRRWISRQRKGSR